jgi:hypothetical protein
MTEVKEDHFNDKQVIEKKEFTEYDEEHIINQETSTFIPPDAKELKAVMWKLDRRIIPFLGLLYLCSFLDRVNIGNAKLAGIVQDLHISPSDYNLALSLFFVGYVSIYHYIYIQFMQ